MLKFIFWSLLGINAVLFALGQGYLGKFKAGEREPARIRNQMNTDKLALLTPAAAASRAAAVPAPAPSAPAAPVEAAPAPAPAADLVACTEVGNFAAGEARRFDGLIAPLELGERVTHTDIQVQEITSHMVMIPPLGSKEAADKKAAQLKELGVSNYFVMNDNSPLKWAISLGVFKSEAAAQTLLAALRKQGVDGAKVAGRTTQSERRLYRFRDIPAEAKAKIDAIAQRFEAVETRSCK